MHGSYCCIGLSHQHDVTYNIAVTELEHKSDIKHTTNTLHLSFRSSNGGVCREDFEENWLHNGTALY